MQISKKLIELEYQRGTLQVLLFLFRNGESNYSTVEENVPAAVSTVRRALKNIVNLELAELRTVAGAPTKFYKLISKGVQIAQKINEIEKILGE